MAMSADTLATEMENMTPTDDEAVAASTFADAFHTFFAAALAGVVAVVQTPVERAAFQGALAGMSASGAGAGKVQSAMQAYWGALTLASFPGTISLPTAPPNLGTVAGLLTSVFAANTSGKLDLAQSADAIAAAMFSGNQGGIAHFPPPPGGVGDQVIL